MLSSGGEETRLYPSAEGYVLSGMAGIFLPAAEKEAFSDLGVIAKSDREYAEESGGVYRLSDYNLQLALNLSTLYKIRLILSRGDFKIVNISGLLLIYWYYFPLIFRKNSLRKP